MIKQSPNSSKSILVRGEVFSSLGEASQKLGESRFLLLQKLYSDDPQYSFYPDHQKQMMIERDKLSKHNALLLDKDFLLQKRENKTSMSDLCKELKVSLDILRTAFYYHGISTKFAQVDESTSSLLNNYDFLMGEITKKTSVKISEELDCSPSLVLQHCKRHGIIVPLRFFSSLEEKVIDFLKTLGINVIIRQDRKILEGMEIDIWLPEYLVGIEIHGLFWHKDKPDLHKNKMLKAEKKGIKLIQIFEDEIQFKFSIVQSKIKAILNKSSISINARQCKIVNLKSSDTIDFLNKTHIQGYKRCAVNVGLEYMGKLVSLVTLNKNKIERSSSDILVKGGFAKIFSYIRKTYNYGEYYTFVDLRWSLAKSNIYIFNGFEFSHYTPPGYFWVVNGKRVNRIKYQKHKLKNMPNFHESKSESDIMRELGYWKIFDAGHASLIFKE